MSVLARAVQRNSAPASRPIIEVPGLSVVPTPAAARGFFGTVLLCAILFFGALATAFYLNTLMVAGAYELKDINVKHNEVAAREATLRSEVISVSSPDQLRHAAQGIGMVSATSLLHIDIETGAVTAPTEGNQ
ncbi:hypothetical protein [Arcanobacterium buesumense]|uniref:Cell division protein FtsL n=1 Tax=Arcanobacterium buesumense TaxID=2722751 RepID=A0A6H2EKB0_9ACTO|nr:hypothetical protein [Arcanobacterium buesumense]QJC21604.1 hypothetical protein HC352_03180 [Arcanobacterium buesumense]